MARLTCSSTTLAEMQMFSCVVKALKLPPTWFISLESW